MFSRLVITFLPGSKCLLISWLQLPSAVILEPPENKVWHCFHCLHIYFPWSDGTRCHDLSVLKLAEVRVSLQSLPKELSSSNMNTCSYNCKIQFETRQGRKEDDLNEDRLPLFRQGGATVGITIGLSTCGVREASYFRGGFAEVIQEDMVRRMNRGGGIPGWGWRVLGWCNLPGILEWDLKFSFVIPEVRWFSKGPWGCYLLF